MLSAEQDKGSHQAPLKQESSGAKGHNQELEGQDLVRLEPEGVDLAEETKAGDDNLTEQENYYSAITDFFLLLYLFCLLYFSLWWTTAQ